MRKQQIYLKSKGRPVNDEALIKDINDLIDLEYTALSILKYLIRTVGCTSDKAFELYYSCLHSEEITNCKKIEPVLAVVINQH